MSSILALVVVVTVVAADRLDMGGSGSDQVVAPPDGTVGEDGSGDTTSTSGIIPSPGQVRVTRSEEHTSELQSLMRNSYAVFCLKKKKNIPYTAINAHIKI